MCQKFVLVQMVYSAYKADLCMQSAATQNKVQCMFAVKCLVSIAFVSMHISTIQWEREENKINSISKCVSV